MVIKCDALYMGTVLYVGGYYICMYCTCKQPCTLWDGGINLVLRPDSLYNIIMFSHGYVVAVHRNYGFSLVSLNFGGTK